MKGMEFVVNHLLVLVHGFQGTHHDMRFLRNQILLQCPNAQIMISSSNEDHTEECIFEMGQRLANEVRQYINSFCMTSYLGKISFIGHSIGGLIIRAALPHLADFSSKFFTYLSFGSPHLGYNYSKSRLITAGVWFLQKWSQSKSLSQLAMNDNVKIEDTCLYTLSTMPGFDWFKNIVFVCS